VTAPALATLSSTNPYWNSLSHQGISLREFERTLLTYGWFVESNHSFDDGRFCRSGATRLEGL
jgi:hypothetical protein